MIPLRIVIKRDGYAIARTFDEQELVSNIEHMEDALSIFRELTMIDYQEGTKNTEADWIIVPGVLSVH